MRFHSTTAEPLRHRTVVGRWLVPLLSLLMAAATTLHAQERRVFNPPGLPSNLPFSNGIQVGDNLYIAGMQGVISGDIEAETRTTLANLKKVIDAAGFKLSDVVQVTVYLKDINDFPKMNGVYREFFPDPKPTRTTVEVARIVNDARVEITSMAVRSHEGSAKWTTRRDFVKRSAAVGALVGIAPATALGAAEAIDASAPRAAVDYYDKLGVAKIINAAGTYTYLTASLMPPEVQAAVAIAAQHPVRLRDLQAAAGAYIAKRLQCEAALVTAGAASALSLGTAGCLTVGNPDASKDVPARTSTLKNEVLIQKGHRFPHDHALEMAGTKLIEVESLADYEKAFTPQTGVAFFFNAAEHGQISREDWIRVAHAHGVPCFIDAAADVPPIANLWNYTKMGFDLVTFSGGKGIRGPQNAGLLLGRKDLVESALANDSPNDRSIGRGMKVAKEQVVGMVAALDWLLDQTDDRIDAEARRRAARIVASVHDLPTLTTEVVVPAVANHVPHLMIRYDQSRIAIKPIDVADALRKGNPSIEVNPGTGHASGAAGLPSDENTIVIGPWMMKPGEDAIVGRRLREVLHGALRPQA